MIEAFRPERAAYRDRRAAGHGGAELGEAHWLCLHHGVPHAVRRIHQGANRDTGAAGLRLDAAVPQRRPGHDGGDASRCATSWRARGFRNIRAWSRGVDLELFKPEPREEWELPRPVFLYVGRVAVEKNIGAFLDLDLPGSKVVVGGGPHLPTLQREYPKVHFTGPRYGEALARAYAGADVFVFPSLTDTFGLVILEALACGTPVAAFPVTGPKDVLADAAGKIGAVNADLRAAALEALGADRAACRAHAERYSWRACAEMFLSHLVPIAGVS